MSVDTKKPIRVSAGSGVMRQTPGSQFSHFEGPWEALSLLVEDCIRKGKVREGRKEGSLIIECPPDRFRSPIICKSIGMICRSEFVVTAVNQSPMTLEYGIGQSVFGRKIKAHSAEVVAVDPAILKEGKSDKDADLEIVRINAWPLGVGMQLKAAPGRPIILAREFLDGKTPLTLEELIDAVCFWDAHCLIGNPNQLDVIIP